MKTIIVPIDEPAQSRLNFNLSEPGDLIELNLNPDIFNTLFKDGFFNLINMITSAFIDDFEDEGITDLALIKRVLDSGTFAIHHNDTALSETIKQI